jgi:hypothetical protein
VSKVHLLKAPMLVAPGRSMVCGVAWMQADQPRWLWLVRRVLRQVGTSICGSACNRVDPRHSVIAC